MPRRPYQPTARQVNVLLAAGFVSLGYALYLRYLAVEYTPVGLACQAGLQTWLCTARRIATVLFSHSVFGWAAVAIAALHFVRPSIVLFTAAVAAAAFGIVLYNVGLSSLAVSLLILALARPALAEA